MGLFVHFRGAFECVRCRRASDALIQTKLLRHEADNCCREYRAGDTEFQPTGAPPMTGIDRRTFLGVVGLTVAASGSSARAGRSANDRVRVAVVGIRSRGTEVAREFARNKGA